MSRFYIAAYLTLSVPQIPEFSETASIQESAKPVYHIPYFPAINFVGREEELQTIHQAFQSTTKPVAISAVAGMGGIGKTQLAVQYAHQHLADYPGGMCWFNVRRPDFATQFLDHVQKRLHLEVPQQIYGKPLTFPEQVEWCWQNWKPPEGLVLVVFDDVIDLKGCKDYLPTSNNRFRVLITTRLQNLDPSRIKKIPLRVLFPEDASKLLSNILGSTDKRIAEEPQAAQNLCRRLGYLPLGLELVGYYLLNDPNYISLSEMLERLEKHGLTDEALEIHQETSNPEQLGVRKAFELSWEEFGAPTQLLGCLLSLFNPVKISWKLVESVSDSLGWQKTDFQKAKNQLFKLHFVQRLEIEGGYCEIHPLIRDFLHTELEKRSEQAEDIKRAFVKIFVAIAKTIPDSPTKKFIISVEDAIPHLAEIASNLTDALQDEDLIVIFTKLAEFYRGQGIYETAERVYVQCLSVVRTRFGDEHISVATSIFNLAKLHIFQGRYNEAETLSKQALEMVKRLLGNEDIFVAKCLNNLANVYDYQARYYKAENLYKQSLEMTQSLLGDEHQEVATSIYNLAILYRRQGRYSEAEPLYKRAL